jgi:hypothetical protein
MGTSNKVTSLNLLVALIKDNTDFRSAEISSSLRSSKSPNVLRIALEKIGHLHRKCSTVSSSSRHLAHVGEFASLMVSCDC